MDDVNTGQYRTMSLLPVLAASVPELLGSSWAQLGTVLIATVAIYGTVILAGRIMGLRSFAKMTAFDFAATVATGSILASASVGSVPLASGVTAIACLFTVQWLVAKVRRNTSAKSVIDNRPLLLAKDGQLLTDNMASASIHADDIRAKMRQTGITRREDLAYVVLESSGDVSVIGRDSEVEDWLMEDVSKDPTREVDRS
ncbi:conserved hypothetical protein-putative membrane protein [Euzebya pacifica]|uniref:YetF C-terminal domain-containing protein n=2 Tax=Euzebya pacifica TaxID=1608957 RepID=A0A346Y150_9ACTN|nr:conserved hypothetical protein-putative membrane protein [Euzebya pacifica]